MVRNRNKGRLINMANFNYNKATIGGRITADPELKHTTQGTAVVSFTVAVNRKGKDQQTDFISCQAWKETAEFICRFFKKGNSICVAGRIQTRTVEYKNGYKANLTELLVEEVFFVDSKSTEPTFTEIDKDAEELPF